MQRALAAAPDRPTGGRVRSEREFFCFRLGTLGVGVPSESVREVMRAGPLTPLPRSPAYILGVAGHRGEVFPVLDLLRFLGKGESRVGPRTRLFVAVAENFMAAVITDAVVGLRRIPDDEILPSPLGGDVSSEHMIGVFQPSGRELVTLLNFSRLLQAAQQRAVAR